MQNWLIKIKPIVTKDGKSRTIAAGVLKIIHLFFLILKLLEILWILSANSRGFNTNLPG